MVHRTPKVQFGYLEPSATEGKSSQTVSIGSVEWYAWLEDHHAFCFENASSLIYMRKEQRASSWYWYAYRRYRGKLLRMYLGKSEELSLERLNERVHSLVTSYPLKTSPPHDLQQGIESTSLLSCNPVMTTKLHFASPPSNLVRRARLIRLLDEGILHKLTLITSPPGFGKTTLLSEWGRTHLGGDLPCAWYSLDESDNDLRGFLIYFISALRTIQANIGENLLTVLLSSQLLMPLNAIMAMLINEITTKIVHDFAFVFDDYHIIETQSIHNALTFLLDRLPPHMHIVIASRMDPPLSLARLRTQGQLTEVHAADLCFFSEEVGAFLNEVMGLSLPTDHVAVIAERAGGWIAGLQLAVLSLQKWGDFNVFIKAFTGSHRYVLDYFAQEVFHRQSYDVQTFLLKTSILTHLNDSLCEAVTGQGDGQTTLGKLEQANLFLFPSDEEQGGYRYHHLFREFLSHQLHRLFPDIVHKLHRIASTWCEHNGLEAEAIDHAIAGKDFERATPLVEQIALSMLIQSKVNTLLKWLEALTGEQVPFRPKLCVFYAWALVFNRQVEAVEPYLQSIERKIDATTTNSKIARPTRLCISITHDEESTEMQWISGQIAAIRAYIAITRGDASQAINLAEHALECLPVNNLYPRGIVALTLGIAHLLKGNALEASHSFSEAKTLSQAAGDISISLTAMCGLARIQIIQGQLHLAAQAYQQALEIATNSPSQVTRTSPVEGMVYVGMGELFREWNQLDTATHYVMKGIGICRQQEVGKIEALGVVNGYIVLARIKYAQGDRGGAFNMLQHADQYMRKYDSPSWVLTSLTIYRVRSRLAGEDFEASTSRSQKSSLSYLQEFEHVTLARILLARGEMKEALTLLDTLLQAAQDAGRIGSVIEIQMLQALAYQGQNKTLIAMKTLEQALLLAEAEGYVRLFVDEGEPMAALLEKVIEGQCKEHQSTVPRFSLNYGRQLLAALGKPTISAICPAGGIFNDMVQSLIEPLSIRELEVLHSIVNGMSNQEIADQMYVAECTIKWHIKNIYGKLNVHNRSQLIICARELKL